MKKVILFGPEGPGYSAEGIVTGKFVQMLEHNNWKVFWIYHIVNDNTTNDPYYIGIRNTLFYALSVYIKNIPILNKILRLDSLLWSLRAYYKAKTICKKVKIDFIFSRIMPAYGHLPALLLSRDLHINWIANWSDPMPRIKAPQPYGLGVNAKIPYLSTLYLTKICEHSSYHSFPSEELKEHYQQYLQISPDKCIILPHISIPQQIKKEHNNEELIISHIGGGLKQRDPSLFFQALSNVLSISQYKSIKMKLQFIGPIEGDIQRKINRTKIKDIITLKGRVTYNESLDYIKSSDIILVIEANMEVGIFLPSKIADIVACDKPLLAVSPQKGTVNRLISKNGGGIVTDCNSIESIENGIKILLDSWIKNKLSDEFFNTRNLKRLFSEDAVYNKLSNFLFSK